MTYNDNSLFSRNVNPAIQALIVLGVILIVQLGGFLCKKAEIMEMDPLFAWLVATSFLLVFALFNSVLSLSSNDSNKYWTWSIFSYIGLALISGSLAYLFSSTSINDARSYKWIYVVLTFGYLVFHSLVGFMRRVVEFAQREEWEAPNRRK